MGKKGIKTSGYEWRLFESSRAFGIGQACGYAPSVKKTLWLLKKQLKPCHENEIPQAKMNQYSKFPRLKIIELVISW